MLGLRSRWRQYWEQKWQQWLQAKIHVFPEKRLNRNNIYIVPTKAGFSLVFTSALILFAAINYENNSLFLLAFVVVAIFLLSILSTFENLQGIVMQCQPPTLVQQGGQALFSLRISPRASRHSYALELSLKEQTLVIDSLEYTQLFSLGQKARRRGRMQAGLIKLESRYPFGLVKAWSYANLGLSALVYPAPQEAAFSAISSSSNARSQQLRQDADDYQNIRAWRQGESPKRILWPAYARSNELLAFDYEQQAHNPRVLDWYALEGDTETKLAILCYWVLRCGQYSEAFSLHLPSRSLALNSGQAAVDEALTALALFGETK